MLVTELGITEFIQPTIKVFVEVLIIALQLSLESYVLFSLETLMEVRSQPKKALSPMLVTELGIVMEVRPVHPAKELLPMLVTELGMVMEVRLVQLQKAQLPMLVTELGMDMEVSPLQKEKASLPMLVTELGMIMEVRLLHPLKA